jgi:hypothetical protein
MGRTLSFIGAAVLFLVGLCFVGYGALALVGLIWLALRGQKTEVIQQVTMKVDVPGDTRIEQMKCQSCGGVITSKDIQIMAGAPVVTCPWCNTTYQLTEEPKW